MKKNFKGMIISSKSDEWHVKSAGAKWMSGSIISIATTLDHKIKTYIHAEYASCEYMKKLNVFSFGRLMLNIPFTVIAPPVSIDKSGFCGNVNSLIADYKCRKGLFLMLNLKAVEVDIKSKVAIGKTLPSCIFKNRFKDFDSYLKALRSNYRRRIKIAIEKGDNLKINSIKNCDFDDKLYNLYLQVLEHSDFPLEKLPITFFQNCGCNIDVFNIDSKPMAFVMYEEDSKDMNFIFGGMDYSFRDKYDLYYNMLIYLIKIGIEHEVKLINLGQTAESTKCRIGCTLEERYMVAFSGNRFLNNMLCTFAPLLENNSKKCEYNVFKA